MTPLRSPQPGSHTQCSHRLAPKHDHNFKIPILFFKGQLSIYIY